MGCSPLLRAKRTRRQRPSLWSPISVVSWLRRHDRSNGARQAGRGPRPRDTTRMKLQATIVLSYRADTFGDAGGALDDVLQRAREREDVEIDGIQLGTPASAGPVSLPYVERPPAPPQRVPHPLPDGQRDDRPLTRRRTKRPVLGTKRLHCRLS